MKIGDLVRLYKSDWYFEGKITKIVGSVITVDFLDWVVDYTETELKRSTIHYIQYWITSNEGKVIKDYR